MPGYPKTADGVTVVPGMRIYPKHPLPHYPWEDYGTVELVVRKNTIAGPDYKQDDFNIEECFSTFEAARETAQ